MADSKPPGIIADLGSLGFGDASLTRAEEADADVDGSTGVAPSSVSPAAALQPEETFFLNDPASWDFQDTPPYETYHGANPFNAALRPTSWDLPVHCSGRSSLGQLQFSHNTDATVVEHKDRAVLGNSAHPIANPGSRTLTTAQQEKLKNAAMPPQLPYRSPNSAESPASNASGNKRASSSPEPTDASKAGSRKRKTSADVEEDDDDDELDGSHPVKRSAHNMIEKRYRTNLNDKIAALRDSVPALRIMSKSARGEDTTEDREELQGLTPAHKLNKATVLSKATEYIRHLEKRNSRLLEENASMMARINAFEKLFIAGALAGQIPNPLQQQQQQQQQQQPLTPLQYPQDSPAFINSPLGAAQVSDSPGIGPVSGDGKRTLSTQQMVAGRPYPIPQQFAPNAALLRQQQVQQQQQEAQAQAQAGRWNSSLGKLMMGSMAGLMLVEALVEKEQSSETTEGRGLFAAPLHLLSNLVHSTHVSVGGHYVSAFTLLARLRLVCLVGLLMWGLLCRSPWGRTEARSEKLRHAGVVEAVPSLASPIHVRRQAWLTAIQTVWVPRHNFSLEAAALLLKAFKYMLRNVVGDRGYLMLTGLSEEQETARVKAWTIALDAQLAGGDAEINRSRLVLTLIASGTLPDTPLRLMMKALHIRLLLWQVNGACSLSNLCGAKLARSRWLEARQLHQILSSLQEASSDPDQHLPDHLTLLLEQDCDEVLDDRITRRAHNLAWNEKTKHEASDMVSGMDSVVEDSAVRSPMDAVAAWYSSVVLQRVLTGGLAKVCADGDDASANQTGSDDVTLAVNIAPIGSHAQLRALIARAVLVPEKRGANIAAALQALGPSMDPDQHLSYAKRVPHLLDMTMTMPSDIAAPDVRTALRCAMAIAHLQRFSAPPQETLVRIDSILPSTGTEGLSLLGYSAVFLLMHYLDKHAVGRETCSVALERLAGSLRIWVGSSDGDQVYLADGLRKQMIDRCLGISKSMVGIQADPGYGSMEDECEGGALC